MGLFDFLTAGSQKRREFKAAAVSEALSGVFAGCSYDPLGKIKYETLRDTGLIDDDWNRSTDSTSTKLRFEYRGNDYFKGLYRGREIECCDAEISKYQTTIETDDKGNETQSESSETAFKGLWLICKTDKAVAPAVRIREKADTPLLFRMVAGKRVRAKGDVETENIAFNERFQILTADAQSAFRVLTPHFMEHILTADEKARGRTFLCFSGDRVHIAIHNGRDAFEIRKNAEMKDPAALKERIQGEIGYFTAILDELFQNGALFKEG